MVLFFFDGVEKGKDCDCCGDRWVLCRYCLYDESDLDSIAEEILFGTYVAESVDSKVILRIYNKLNSKDHMEISFPAYKYREDFREKITQYKFEILVILWSLLHKRYAII